MTGVSGTQSSDTLKRFFVTKYSKPLTDKETTTFYLYHIPHPYRISKNKFFFLLLNRRTREFLNNTVIDELVIPNVTDTIHPPHRHPWTDTPSTLPVDHTVPPSKSTSTTTIPTGDFCTQPPFTQ